MNNFHQTVDLREQAEKRRGQRRPSVSPLEKIYEDEEANEPKEDLKNFSRPMARQTQAGLIRTVIFILAILIIGLTVYFLFLRQKPAATPALARDWYAVKLVDGEIFYGQIADVKADPVVMANVYYNYDRAGEKAAAKEQPAKTPEEAGNLRLVKRGKETQGGSGLLNVVRGQILYMEPLKTDSKVLQAILEYEK